VRATNPPLAAGPGAAGARRGAGTAPPRRAWRVFVRTVPAMGGVVVLLAVAAMALLAPVIHPGDPLEIVARPFQWPGDASGPLLGTDALGRDVLAGIVHGSRVSLVVGISATVIGLTLGILVGAVAGYFGGRVDTILVRLIELFQTLPQFVLVVVLLAIVQPSITTITLSIGIVTWPVVARLVRAEYRSLREREFVVAARAAGYGDARIMVYEILPNALSPVIVTSSVMVASAILMESALSFLGLGDPNLVSWGTMIGAGRESLRTAWFLSAIPGVAIVLVVLALNFIGEGLNDALNPRFAGRA
jgi:peptide/nickel transport system permease protein